MLADLWECLTGPHTWHRNLWRWVVCSLFHPSRLKEVSKPLYRADEMWCRRCGREWVAFYGY